MYKTKDFKKQTIVFDSVPRQINLKTFLKRKANLFIKTPLFFFVLSICLGFGSQAQAVEHPFLIVKESEYAEMRTRANSEPWKSMKADAIDYATNKNYNPLEPNLQTRMQQMTDVLGPASLAYILDPANKTTYLNKIKTTLNYWGSFWTEVRSSSLDGYYKDVYMGGPYLRAILALDVIHDDLTPLEISTIEGYLNITGTWYWNNYSSNDNRYGSVSVWAIYKNDATWAPRIAPAIGGSGYYGYYNATQASMMSDGVYIDGISYSQWRLSGSNKMNNKPYPMDIIAYTGYGTPYSDAKYRNFYEWTYGYSITPFNKTYSFGDGDSYNAIKNGGTLFRAYKFSSTAAKYASWAYTLSGKPKPYPGLIDYVLYKVPLPAAEIPKSKIFSSGAWLYEVNMISTSLGGVLWSTNANNPTYHMHKETNSLNLFAFGEFVLRNVGYLAGTPSPWDAWVKTAEAGNTVLINGIDHQEKLGGAITEGLLGLGFNYASGYSGNALPNGKHTRNFVFIHPQDGKNGYWILYDEITANTAGNPINVILHPNSDSNPATTGNKYKFSIKDNADVKLSIFFGTNPNSVNVKDGMFAREKWIGKYLYSNYNTSSTKKNIVTVLFPSDASHAEGNMSSISGFGYTGASITQGSATDYAFESSGGSIITHNGVKFQGLASWYRSDSGNISSYFTRAGRSFDDGKASRQGFETDHNISIYMKDKIGMVTAASSGGVKIYYPGINLVKIDGADATVLGSGTGWMNITIPSGAHSIALNGAVAPVISPGGGGDGGCSAPASCTGCADGTVCTGGTCSVGSCVADTTIPDEIIIDCPDDGDTYSLNSISVSGTASDSVGVSRVEVKVCPNNNCTGASIQSITPLGTSWITTSNLTLSAGSNTVYAKAFDAAGNFRETSITVTYDPDATGTGSGHPNMFINQYEINEIKKKISAQPWKSAYAELISRADAAELDPSNQSITYGGPAPLPGYDIHDYYAMAGYSGGDRYDNKALSRVSNDVRDLGLAYAFTGLDKYAVKATQLIKAWALDPATYMRPRYTDFASQIDISFTLPGMFYGADLIYDYPGWDPADKSKFLKWATDLGNSAKTSWTGTNNFEDWRIVTIATAGALTDNDDLLTYAFNGYKSNINNQIIGTTIVPSSSPVCGTDYECTDGEKPYLPGQLPQERRRTRALTYSMFALDPMIQTAEIARHTTGENLYDYVGPRGQSLKLALDYHSPYVANPTTWPYSEDPTYNGYTGDDSGAYELAYSYWGDSSYMAALNKWDRATYKITKNYVIGPVALTHASGAYDFKFSASSGSSLPPPTCAAPTILPTEPATCGNSAWDVGIKEICEKTTNQGCFGSSMCNSDCTACVMPPLPPPICYGVICDNPGYCQKGLGRCIDDNGSPVCIYYNDADPCEDNDGDPCKMGACSSGDGGRTGFCDKAKSDVVCGAPGFCQAGTGQCVATSLTDYVCSYNDDPEPCDLDDNECTLDVCKSTDGNFNSSCIATNLDACEGIVPCGRIIDNPKTNWDETASCEFCHLILILNRTMNFLMELVAIVSLLAIIITGLLFITSAGNPEIKNKAATSLKWIVIGLIIVFIAWLLIDFLLSAWGYLDPLGGKWNVIC